MRMPGAAATGAVGRNLLLPLVAAGYQVVGTRRSVHKAGLIGQLGGKALVADGLDAAAIGRAVQSARSDAIVHKMTDLKGGSHIRHVDRVFAVSNLRTEGTDHLLAAARETGVKRFVAQSVCGRAFARVGYVIKSDDDPLDLEPPKQLRRTLDAIRFLEEVVRDARDVARSRHALACQACCRTASGQMPRDMRLTFKKTKRGLKAVVETMIGWNPRVIFAHGHW